MKKKKRPKASRKKNRHPWQVTTLQRQTMGYSAVPHWEKPQHPSHARNVTDKGDWDNREASAGSGTASTGTQ